MASGLIISWLAGQMTQHKKCGIVLDISPHLFFPPSKRIAVNKSYEKKISYFKLKMIIQSQYSAILIMNDYLIHQWRL